MKSGAGLHQDYLLFTIVLSLYVLKTLYTYIIPHKLNENIGFRLKVVWIRFCRATFLEHRLYII